MKFVPYEKLSKKKQRDINKSKRSVFADKALITRVDDNKKGYNRKKLKDSERKRKSPRY